MERGRIININEKRLRMLPCGIPDSRLDNSPEIS